MAALAAQGNDVGALYAKCVKGKSELETLVEAIAEKKTSSSEVAAQQRLAALSADLERTVASLRAQVRDQAGANKVMWERRCNNLDDDVRAIQQSMEKHCGQFSKRQKEEDDRKALFGDGDRSKAGGGAGDDTQGLIKERNALTQAGEMLDDILGQGKGTLGQLVGQNKVLKVARKKLLDAANVMGVSASLVSVIDRRQTTDKWLVYGGMALTLFVLFSLWYLLRM